MIYSEDDDDDESIFNQLITHSKTFDVCLRGREKKANLLVSFDDEKKTAELLFMTSHWKKNFFCYTEDTSFGWQNEPFSSVWILPHIIIIIIVDTKKWQRKKNHSFGLDFKCKCRVKLHAKLKYKIVNIKRPKKKKGCHITLQLPFQQDPFAEARFIIIKVIIISFLLLAGSLFSFCAAAAWAHFVFHPFFLLLLNLICHQKLSGLPDSPKSAETIYNAQLHYF